MRELKVFMKTREYLNEDIRYELQFEKQMVIDLDLFEEIGIIDDKREFDE